MEYLLVSPPLHLSTYELELMIKDLNETLHSKISDWSGPAQGISLINDLFTLLDELQEFSKTEFFQKHSGLVPQGESLFKVLL